MDLSHPISASRSPPTPPLHPSDANTSDPSQPSLSPTKHIWVITGPAGCGKTSVAENLHAVFGVPYLEGDDFHTPENVAKMSQGHPLTDADRWDWLIRLREEALAVLHQEPSVPRASPASASASPPAKPPRAVLITCSALKRKYRDVLRVAALEDARVAVHFVFLALSEDALLQRVRARQGHYMKESMVRSQLQSLETPRTEVERDVYVVDAGLRPEEVGEAAKEVVERAMKGV